MAHEIRTRRPDIPLLLDPSHMSGDARQVPALMVKITELGLDGAMVEIHCCPEQALSDAQQQITPAKFGHFIETIKGQTTDKTKEDKTLKWLRAEIDELDETLWETLAARMEVSQRIGTWKKAHHMAPLQPKRYTEILDRRQQWATKNGINTAFVQQLFDAIHAESLKRQKSD